MGDSSSLSAGVTMGGAGCIGYEDVPNGGDSWQLCLGDARRGSAAI